MDTIAFVLFFDFMQNEKAASNGKDFKLFGFKNGPRGIFTGDYIELTSEIVDRYRNTGVRYDRIGSRQNSYLEQLANSLCTLQETTT